jgi:hypothetical protein
MQIPSTNKIENRKEERGKRKEKRAQRNHG